MTLPTRADLKRLIEISETPEDLDYRVCSLYGKEFVAHGRKIAEDIHGDEWSYLTAEHSDSKPTVSNGSQRDGLASLQRPILQSPWGATRREAMLYLGASAFAIILLLFPPFELTIQENLTIHTGFHFLFLSETGSGKLGRVNVSLLLIELLVLLGCVAALKYTFRQLEHSPEA